MANSRYYSSTAAVTTLQVTAQPSDASVQVASSVGFPNSFPFTLSLDYGSANEELVDVTGGGPSIFNVTRGVDGTSATTHNAGAVVRHVSSARDFTDSRTHEASSTNVHGITGAFVDTQSTQTLSNKTLTNPTINNATVTGTVAATGATVSGATYTNSTLTNPTINAASLSGTFTGSPTYSGVPSFTAGQSVTGGPVNVTGATSTSNAININSPGDSTPHFTIQSNGVLNWGPGNAAQDVNLYRGAANLLQTDDAFQTAGAVTAAGITSNGNATINGNLTVTGTINAGGVGTMSFASKAASTSRSNTTTLAVDPDLQVTLAASTTWELHGMLFFSGDTTGDLKIGFTAPANAQMRWAGTGQPTTATGTTGSVITDGQDLSNLNFGLGNVSGSIMTVKLDGLIAVGLTGGTFGLMWAQTSSSSTATVLYDKSYLKLTRVQ